MNKRQIKRLAHIARKLGRSMPTGSESQGQEQSQTPIRTTPRRSTFHAARWVIGCVATVLTIATGIFAFRFDVNVEPYALPDQSLPFSQLFSVGNASLFTIYDLTPRCQVDVLRDTRGNNFSFGGMTKMREFIAELAPGAKTTATCSISGAVEWTELRIKIVVQYRTPFRFRRCKAVRFDGVPHNGNAYTWAYHGSEPCEWFDYRRL